MSDPKEENTQIQKINEVRWELDLPPIDEDDWGGAARRHMDEKYGYDIDK